MDMRRAIAIGCLFVLAACPTPFASNAQPIDRLYFPTGVARVDVPGKTHGVLFVANANFDKRYESGMLVALDLDALDLPAFGAPVAATGPRQVTDLKLSEQARAEVSSFTGELGLLQLAPNKVRLFVPTRSEHMKYEAVDATFQSDGSTSLTCATTPGRNERECASFGVSLSPLSVEQSATGLPRAPSPYGVAVKPRPCYSANDCRDGDQCNAGFCQVVVEGSPVEPFADVFVTHLAQADSPFGMGTNPIAYVVRLDSTLPKDFTIQPDNYLPLGTGGTNSAVVGSRWVYLSGRIQTVNFVTSAANLVRLVDRFGDVLSSGVENVYGVIDSRGIALSHDESRIYLAGQSPDTLLVLSVTDPTSDAPAVGLQRVIPLPDGANEVVAIPRPGRSDLVAITCIAAGALVLYDDDVGDIVALVPGVGVQPFGVAYERQGAGARLYVSNFSDGRIAVIDLLDLARPVEARLVAHIGRSQQCLTGSQNGTPVSCGDDGGTP
jgi:hypothetical protein